MAEVDPLPCRPMTQQSGEPIVWARSHSNSAPPLSLSELQRSDHNKRQQTKIFKKIMTSLQLILPLAAQLLPLLSLIYSVAVHIFLSSFNERSLWKFRHWKPIRARALFCCTTWIFVSSAILMEASPANYVVGNRNDKKIVISTPFAAINIIIIIAVMSIRLIVQTPWHRWYGTVHGALWLWLRLTCPFFNESVVIIWWLSEDIFTLSMWKFIE